ATSALTPRAAVLALPTPLVGIGDPAAPLLASLTVREPIALLAALAAAPVDSREIDMKRALIHLELGEQESARRILGGISEWRAEWYLAMSALAAGALADARRRFDDLYDLAPGELAPKLGLAFCCELLGDLPSAERYYQAVWRTDETFVSAAFGLARVRLAGGDRVGAIRSLDAVPPVSSHYVTAQIAAVNAVVLGRGPAELVEADLLDAGRRLSGLGLDAERYGRLAVEILLAALAWLSAGNTGSASRLLDAPLTATGLRTRLERAYRFLARHADEGPDRHHLIMQANAVRPRTLF
ncbi:tetratricopeptide repeat protein, partial [Actinocorallia lasiicapitis]